jgi:catechol 2,3-dioxygenase-like lactoylglutathione lyase family enzyme
MNRAFTNILCGNVAQTAQFYQDLLGMTRAGDFGWFILLTHDGLPGFELGVLDRTHDTLPPGVAGQPGGAMLTFVVDDVEQVHQQAKALRAEVLEPPSDMPYGQRRMLLRDPAGTLMDVSALIR